TPGLEAQHTIIYVWKGSAIINGETVETDNAVYHEDFAAIKAGTEGAVLWRWELVPDCDPIHLPKGERVNSILRMSRKVKMYELVPTSKWLFRLDCIMNAEGSTGLHSHPGSGIRCMLNGSARVDSLKGESSYSGKAGACWYEEGSYPIVTTFDPGTKATFLRGMVLTPEYIDYPDTALWIEKVNRQRTSSWKCYVQKVVTLR
ncbi:hypothetical protein ACFLYL_02240, partial [Chloroflexota bacterium]